MWRSEDNLGHQYRLPHFGQGLWCFPAACFMLNGSWASGASPVSTTLLLMEALGLQTWATVLGFQQGVGIWTQVLPLSWQALYPLASSCSPVHHSLSKVPHKPEFKAVLLSCLFSELPSATYEIYRLLKVVCFPLVNLFVRGQQLRTERERLLFLLSSSGFCLGGNPSFFYEIARKSL